MAKKASTKTARTTAKVSARNSRNRNNGLFNTRNSREKGMVCAIIALAILLIGSIGVAVAAFSTDLYIRGTATLTSTVWDIHFENLQPVATNGEFAKEVTAPTIQTSVDGNPMASIKNYDVELKEPGDYIEYTFDIVNAGTMDAKIDALTINTGSALSCSSAAGQDAANKVCENLNYTLTYSDGTPVAVGDTLTASQSRTAKLKLEFDPNTPSDALPSKDVAISGLAVIITYGQDN